MAQADLAAGNGDLGQREILEEHVSSPPASCITNSMSTDDITRVPNRTLPSKSSVAVYRLPGGGGFLWAVATSPDRTQDIKVQTLGCLGVIDGYLTATASTAPAS